MVAEYTQLIGKTMGCVTPTIEDLLHSPEASDALKAYLKANQKRDIVDIMNEMGVLSKVYCDKYQVLLNQLEKTQGNLHDEKRVET